MSLTSGQADALRQYEAAVASAGVSSTEDFIIRANHGVGIPRMPFEKIATMLCSMSGVPLESRVTRQAVHLRAKRAIAKIGDGVVAKLVAAFPPAPSASETKRVAAAYRKSIKEYFEDLLITEEVDYEKAVTHLKLGQPVPEHRVGCGLTGVEACRAMSEDFGVSVFGERYRVCTFCPPEDSVHSMDDFYRIGGDGDARYQVCKRCNTLRCRVSRQGKGCTKEKVRALARAK